MINFLDLADDLTDKSILITGGSGFFGKNLCEILSQLNQKKNLNMKIFSLARNPIQMNGVEFISHDVVNPFNFDVKVDLIIHAATPVVQGDGDFEETMNIIVNGTQNVLNFAEKSKCEKILLVSSGAAYGEFLDGAKLLCETDPISGPFFNFKSPYGTGKRISELLALAWAKKTGKHITIARCFAFSGCHLPFDKHLAIGNFVGSALKEKNIKIMSDGSAIRSYLDAEDLCLWLLTILLKAKSSEIYNVGSDREISIKDLALKVAEHIPGTKVEILGEVKPEAIRNRYVPEIKKAVNELGLKISVTLDESIQKMIDFNKRK